MHVIVAALSDTRLTDGDSNGHCDALKRPSPASVAARRPISQWRIFLIDYPPRGRSTRPTNRRMLGWHVAKTFVDYHATVAIVGGSTLVHEFINP